MPLLYRTSETWTRMQVLTVMAEVVPLNYGLVESVGQGVYTPHQQLHRQQHHLHHQHVSYISYVHRRL